MFVCKHVLKVQGNESYITFSERTRRRRSAQLMYHLQYESIHIYNFNLLINLN
jgi:hypothetical protein